MNRNDSIHEWQWCFVNWKFEEKPKCVFLKLNFVPYLDTLRSKRFLSNVLQWSYLKGHSSRNNIWKTKKCVEIWTQLMFWYFDVFGTIFSRFWSLLSKSKSYLLQSEVPLRHYSMVDFVCLLPIYEKDARKASSKVTLVCCVTELHFIWMKFLVIKSENMFQTFQFWIEPLSTGSF